jgi:hypothetical protein
VNTGPGSFLFLERAVLYSTLFLPSQEVGVRGGVGELVTSYVLLVQKLAVTATVGLNRDFTKLSKIAGSGRKKFYKQPEQYILPRGDIHQ